MAILAPLVYIVGLASVLTFDDLGLAVSTSLFAPLLLGAVVGRLWATAIPLVLLLLLLGLLALFPPDERSAGAGGIALVILSGTATQSALIVCAIILRRLLLRSRRGAQAAAVLPTATSRPRRVLNLLLFATSSVLALLFVLVALTLLLPTRFGVFSARNWTRPVPDDDRALPLLGGATTVSRIEPLLSRLATRMAYARTEVRCWSEEDWKYRPRFAGYYSPANRAVQLSPRVCSELVKLAYEHEPVPVGDSAIDLARSLGALAHESMHALGYGDEAEAECYAMQSIRWTAQSLGARGSEGQYLATLYWRERYPEIPDGDYRSPECRDGGRLDVQPGRAVWP